MRHQKRQAPSDRRASIRSAVLAAATGLTLRPLTAVIPANRAGVRISRQIVAGSLALASPTVPGSKIMRVDRPTMRGPYVRGEWVRGPRARRQDAVVLYTHGSAYALCSSRTHRGITTRFSEQTGLPVFSCDYRLAPRYRFPSAADDVRAAYEWLLAEGHDAARIVVAGDSAGGHLAVDLALQLIREGKTPPATLVLFSPVFDLTMGLAAQREQVRRDPMISAARAAGLLKLYLADTDPVDGRLAFCFDGVDRFPATLVHAGAREMLAADAEELARSVRAAGGFCELVIWPGQMHVFQALTRLVPEAGQALAEAADFVCDQLEIQLRRSGLAPAREA